MPTASQTHEGTLGAWPSAMTGDYGAFTWTSSPAGSSTDVQISDTVAKVGTRSARYNSSCYQGESYLVTTTNGTYFRAYYYLTAAPSADFAVATLLRDSFGNSHNIGITSDRRVYLSMNQTGSISNDTVGTVTESSANSVPLAQWFRVEGYLSNTQGRVRLFANADLALGSDTYDSGTQTVSSLGTVSMMEFGVRTYNDSAAYTFLSSGEYLYIDDLRIDTAGYAGPAASAGGTSFAGIVRI